MTPEPQPRRRLSRRRGRRHRFASLLVLAAALVTTGGLYTAFAPAPTAQATVTGDVPGNAEQGRELFIANCSTCHGLNAEGSTDGPSLVGVGAAAVHFQVGTGRMPLAQPGPQAPRGRVLFSQEQVRDMAAYIATLGPGPAIPTAEETDYSGLTAEQVAEGGEIFRTNCAMCHNFAGSGGALTEGKYAPSLHGVAPVHIFEAMLTGPQSMPVFADTTIPVEEKKQIVAYLKSVEDQPSVGGSKLGQYGAVPEGLIAWVAGIGAMVAVAVWIGAKSS